MIQYNPIISFIELCVLLDLSIILKRGLGRGQMQYIHIAMS